MKKEEISIKNKIYNQFFDDVTQITQHHIKQSEDISNAQIVEITVNVYLNSILSLTNHFFSGSKEEYVDLIRRIGYGFAESAVEVADKFYHERECQEKQ